MAPKVNPRPRDHDGLPVIEPQPRFTMPPNFSSHPGAVAAALAGEFGDTQD